MEAGFQLYEQADVNPGKVTPVPMIPQIALKKNSFSPSDYHLTVWNPVVPMRMARCDIKDQHLIRPVLLCSMRLQL